MCSNECSVEPNEKASIEFAESNVWSSHNYSSLGFGMTYYDNGVAENDYFENYSI